MRILNIGSLNIDLTYSVPRIVAPGETMETKGLQINIGGKGLNQSISLSKAYAEVYHMGLIGEDGAFLKQFLNQNKVDTTYVETVKERSGHAVIQVDETGENSILIYHGANFSFTREKLDRVLSSFKHSVLVLQNEINEMAYIIDKAYEYGMFIILNPSPITKALKKCDLSKIHLFILNETEAKQIAGGETTDAVIRSCKEKFPLAQFVMTRGQNGSVYFDARELYEQKAYPASPVDTTGAGDTFAGYFIATYVKTEDVVKSMEYASIAAALSVMRNGAAQSVPTLEEVEAYRKSL